MARYLGRRARRAPSSAAADSRHAWKFREEVSATTKVAATFLDIVKRQIPRV